MNELERKKRILQLREKLEKLRLIEENYKKTHAIEYWNPYPYQQDVVDSFSGGLKVVCMPVSNKLGKTGLGANLALSWCYGYEPWNKVDKDYPGAVKVGDTWYKPSSLGKKPPIRLRVTGEDWEKHVGMTLVPELKKWAIEGTYKTLKNNMGVEANWTFSNGSVLDIMTYKQDVSQFEGWLGDAWWADEPPSKEIWSAMSRGLFLTGGRVFMSMTPLKEAWVLDDLVLSGRPDVKAIMDLTVWDNPDLYTHDKGVLIQCGMNEADAIDWLKTQKIEAASTKNMEESERNLKKKVGLNVITIKDEYGQTRETDAYQYAMQSLKIHRFIRDLPSDEERMPRVFGQFRSLVGLVVKSFDPTVHITKDFKIPTDWPVTFQIDPHPVEKQAVAFYTVDKLGIKYQIDEIWENLSPEELADEIIRRKTQNAWRIEVGEIDPYSKGDISYVKNRGIAMEDTYTIMKRRLNQHGILLNASARSETSKESGVENINSWLRGPNKVPVLYFFDKCKETVRQLQRWVRDENGKPKKENDHFPECLYRFTLMGFKYTEPIDDIVANFKQMEVAVA